MATPVPNSVFIHIDIQIIMSCHGWNLAQKEMQLSQGKNFKPRSENNGVWAKSGIPPVLVYPWAKNTSYILKWLKNNKMMLYMWNICEIHIVVSLNKALLEYRNLD